MSLKHYLYSHNGGDEHLPIKQKEEIVSAVGGCEVPCMRGNGPIIRDDIVACLTRYGWSGEVRIDQNSKISIASQKNQTGLGIQTSGNASRMYADLMKLQKLYIDGSLKSGVLILPTVNAARLLGDNLANSDRLQLELDIFHKVIFMPILVVAFE